MLVAGSEGATVGEEVEGRGDTQMVSGGAGETAELVRGEEQETMQGLQWSGERGGPDELCGGTEGAAVC